MEVYNCYILLYIDENPYMVENAEGVIHINLESTPVVMLQKAFPDLKIKSVNFENEDDKSFYNSMFVKHLESSEHDLQISIHEVSEKTYITVKTNKDNYEDAISELERIHDFMISDEMSRSVLVIVSYDAISEYYCNKIYPKLNELERVLRRLFFDIYVFNYGADYLNKTISEDLKDKAKKVIQAKGGQKKSSRTHIQQFFYALEFSDIQNMLFKPQWTSVDEEIRHKFLEEHKNLSELSDEILRDIISSGPKSDWERLFLDKKINQSIEELIESIRKYRNNIAHCKFFYKKDYEDCLEKIEELIDCANRAIYITETEDFFETNIRNYYKSLESIFDRMQEIIIPVTRAFQNFVDNSSKAIEMIQRSSNAFNDVVAPAIDRSLHSIQNLSNSQLIEVVKKKDDNQIDEDKQE